MKSLQFSALAIFLVGCGGGEPPEAIPPQPVTVDAVEVQRGAVHAVLVTQATAHAVRRKPLYFEQDGRVTYVKSAEGRELRIGDKVSGPKGEDYLGELLAQIDDREVTASLSLSKAELARSQSQARGVEARLKSARADVDAAERALARATKLRASGSAPQRDVDDANDRLTQAKSAVSSASADLSSARSGSKASRASLERQEVAKERVAVFAPFDGVVAALNIHEGDLYFVSAASSRDPVEQLRTAPMVIVDPSEYEFEVDLPPFQAAQVKPGQPVYIISSDTLSQLRNSGRTGTPPAELSAKGEVFAVSPAIDPGDRSVRVVIRTTANAERLRDGEFVSCFVVVGDAEDVVVAPTRSVERSEEGAIAWVVGADSKLQRRELEVGLRGLDGIEIKSGLKVGDVLVTRGGDGLSPGTEVAPTIQSPAAKPQAEAESNVEPQPEVAPKAEAADVGQ